MEKLNSIKCPNCGNTIGFVRGEYSLRCGKCKLHPVISGDTERENSVPLIKIRGVEHEYHILKSKSISKGFIVLAPIKDIQQMRWMEDFEYVGVCGTYNKAKDKLDKLGIANIQFIKP